MRREIRGQRRFLKPSGGRERAQALAERAGARRRGRVNLRAIGSRDAPSYGAAVTPSPVGRRKPRPTLSCPLVRPGLFNCQSSEAFAIDRDSEPRRQLRLIAWVVSRVAIRAGLCGSGGGRGQCRTFLQNRRTETPCRDTKGFGVQRDAS